MVMKECDEDGDGFIDLLEFVSNCIHRCTPPDCFV
jgi:Ca2+-binding EF-hand superfamily protein